MSTCIVCHTPETFAFKKHGFTIMTCPNCHLYRTVLNQPYSQLLKTYYTRSYFTGSSHRAGYADYVADQPIIRRNAQNYLQLLKHYQPTGKLLDVGCATGIFLTQAQNQGYTVRGIDTSSYAIFKAKKLLPTQVTQATLSTAKFRSGSFDVITLFDVFEHLHTPIRDLRTCYRLLKPGGLLVINTGDTASLIVKLQSHHWHFFIPPQHLYFYSRHNLKTLLKANGFQTIRTIFKGKHISLRYLWHLMRVINQSQLADWLYRKFHHTFIGKLSLYLNLYDNMTIIARKIS